MRYIDVPRFDVLNKFHVFGKIYFQDTCYINLLNLSLEFSLECIPFTIKILYDWITVIAIYIQRTNRLTMKTNWKKLSIRVYAHFLQDVKRPELRA